VVTDNVFIVGAGASGLVDTAGANNWVIEHNTFASDANSLAGISDIRFQTDSRFFNDTPSNNVVRDNIFNQSGGISNECSCNWGVEDHNLNGNGGTGDVNGTPVFVGGSGYAAWYLAAGSPGIRAASTGTDMGIN
jgi:hypothetical protein